jgi:hypothetical protein
MTDPVPVAVPRKGRPLEAVLERFAAVTDGERLDRLADDVSNTLRYEKAVTKGSVDADEGPYERLAEYSDPTTPTEPEFTLLRDDRDGKPRRIVFDAATVESRPRGHSVTGTGRHHVTAVPKKRVDTEVDALVPADAVVANDEDVPRVTGVEDGRDFLVDGAVHRPHRVLVTRAFVKDVVGLLELEKPEVRVELREEVSKGPPAHRHQTTVRIEEVLTRGIGVDDAVHPVRPGRLANLL